MGRISTGRFRLSRWVGALLGTGALALLLASCATTYAPLGARGGYRDFQQSQTQYYVYFYANGSTSQSVAYRFFLTRAAQIALKRGYRYFYVYHLKHAAGSVVYETPGMARTYIYRRVMPGYFGEDGFLRGPIYQRRITIYQPPTYTRIDSPGYRGQILLVHRRLKGQPAPFDARILYREGIRLNTRVEQANRRTGIAVGVGTAVAIGVLTAAAFFEAGGTISFGAATY